MNNSIKRYARNSIQAFPRTLEYGAAMEIPYRKKISISKVLLFGLVLYVMLVVSLIL